MISEYTLCARRFGAFLLVKGSTLAGYLRRRDAPLPAGIKRELDFAASRSVWLGVRRIHLLKDAQPECCEPRYCEEDFILPDPTRSFKGKCASVYCLLFRGRM